MASSIDVTKPVYGNPTTQSVRDNFSYAYDEITDLQNRTTGAPFLPIDGGIMNGPITMQTDPLNPLEVATKRYIDNLVFGGGNSGVPEAPSDNFAYARENIIGGMTWTKTPQFQQIHFTRDGTLDDFYLGSDTTYNFVRFGSATNDYLRFNRTTKNFEMVANNIVVQTWNSSATTISNLLAVNSLTVSGSTPTIHLNSPTVADEYIYFETNNLKRWAIGAAAGAVGFGIYNYDASGVLISKTFGIDPASGLITVYNKAQFNNDINTFGAVAIPADKFEPWISAGEIVIRQDRHLAFNAYIGKDGSNNAAWKPLVTGYSGSIYQSSIDGQMSFAINASAAAGTLLTGITMSFLSNGFLQLNNGGLVSNGPVQSNTGRIVSQSNNPAVNPSVAVWSIDGSVAYAMYTNASRTFYFATANGDGTPVTPIASFTSIGDFYSVRDIHSANSIYCANGLYIHALNSYEWSMYVVGGDHIYAHRATWYDHWNGTNGTRSWYSPSGAIMALDGNGNLSTLGSITCGGNNLACGTFYPAGSIQTIQSLAGFSCFAGGANGRYYQMESNAYICKNPDNADIIIGNYNSGAINLANAAGTAYLRNDAQFIITSNGWKPGGGPWADGSDARMKQIEGEYTKGLAAIIQLQPRIYTFLGNETLDEVDIPISKFARDNAPLPIEPMPEQYKIRPIRPSSHAFVAEQKKQFIGLIAQETEDHMHEMISLAAGTIDGEHVDDIRMMDTTALSMAFINAFKEISDRLIALENRP